MKLYHYPLSGHAHRAVLFLSLLGVKADLVVVDIPNGGHKAPDYLKLNPFGQVPVLEDEGVVVNDSNAILVYVATKLNRKDWLPDDLPTIAGRPCPGRASTMPGSSRPCSTGPGTSTRRCACPRTCSGIARRFM